MYQNGGSERDSAAERMIANEIKILENPSLQRTLGLNGDEIEYIAYAVKMHALSVARQIINNEEVNKTYNQAQEEIKESNLSDPLVIDGNQESKHLSKI